MLREHFHLRFKLFTADTLACSIFKRISCSSNRCTSAPLAIIVTHFLLQLVFNVVFLEEVPDGFEIIELWFGFQLGFSNLFYIIDIKELGPVGHIDQLHVIIVGFQTHLFEKLR